MRLVEDKIGGMLEGISDATERNAAAQMQLDLQKKLQAAAAKYGSLTKEDFRLEMVKLAVEAGLTPDPQVSRSCRRHNFAPDRAAQRGNCSLWRQSSCTVLPALRFPYVCSPPRSVDLVAGL